MVVLRAQIHQDRLLTSPESGNGTESLILWEAYERSAERARDIFFSGMASTFLLFQIL
jgi:hypothetical protein